jgi:peptidoglycan/xylan/chitin deacetylase (PgdA/CDA1 family)
MKARSRITPASIPLTLAMAFATSLALAQPAPKGPPPRDTGAGALARRVPADAGSADAPLLFCIGMHIEPFGATVSRLVSSNSAPPQRPPGAAKGGPGFGGPGGRRLDYNDEVFFRRHCQDIRTVAALVEKFGGKLTVQAQTPFTSVAARTGDKILGELEQRGHEIGLHLHEDAHLGRGSESLPPETWAAVMREQLDLLRQAGATRLRYWSGGNLYAHLLDAASRAGLDVMSDHKNPRQQRTDARLLAIHPWRPAGGPTEDDLAAFTRHDPRGKVIYLPDGIFARADHASMRRSAEAGGDWGYFDTLTEGLELSLRAARPDRVNVFHFTIHAGEFRGPPSAPAPFAVLEAWLRDVLAPLVRAGKVRWATFSEMADAYVKWEKTNAGVDPRGPATRGVGAGTKSASAAPAAAPAPDSAPKKAERGFITFAVNTHDWTRVEESAATVLRLIGIFEKHKVRGDFYLTAQIVEQYERKRPDVIERLKQSGMGISYHCRPPHPTYGGFDGRLRQLDDDALARALRDYETYRLDPATGELQRDQPGGFAYVARVFGRPPVVVSPQGRDPRIRAAAFKLYAELGAKMVVAYHESGTKPDQPFEWVHGLLARPSDFSITRWPAAGGRAELFWWSMLDTPRAAEFDPAARLESQLAAWRGPRAPFITALIHENDFSRAGGPGWNAIYYVGGDARAARPQQPPFDLAAPDRATPRPAAAREKIWRAYEELVARAAAQLRVVTAEDIARMAVETRR